MINADKILKLQSFPDPVRGKIDFKLVVSGGVETFKMINEGEIFYDNDVPESPATISLISYDTEAQIITIFGNQSFESLLN